MSRRAASWWWWPARLTRASAAAIETASREPESRPAGTGTRAAPRGAPPTGAEAIPVAYSLPVCCLLAKRFPDREIVSAPSGPFGWARFRTLSHVDDPLKREFHAETRGASGGAPGRGRGKSARCSTSGRPSRGGPRSWPGGNSAAPRDEDRASPDPVFRDPCRLGFLGLKEVHGEKDLEAFILDLGAGFAFVARRKRITVDEQDYHPDPRSHRRNHREPIAAGSRLGAFQAADKGQTELHLRWPEKDETEVGEEPPLGLILRAGKSDDHVELLRLDKSGSGARPA